MCVLGRANWGKGEAKNNLGWILLEPLKESKTGCKGKNTTSLSQIYDVSTHMTHFREERARSRALFGDLECDEECEKEATTTAKAAAEKNASAEKPAILEGVSHSEDSSETTRFNFLTSVRHLPIPTNCHFNCSLVSLLPLFSLYSIFVILIV